MPVGEGKSFPDISEIGVPGYRYFEAGSMNTSE